MHFLVIPKGTLVVFWTEGGHKFEGILFHSETEDPNRRRTRREIKIPVADCLDDALKRFRYRGYVIEVIERSKITRIDETDKIAEETRQEWNHIAGCSCFGDVSN